MHFCDSFICFSWIALKTPHAVQASVPRPALVKFRFDAGPRGPLLGPASNLNLKFLFIYLLVYTFTIRSRFYAVFQSRFVRRFIHQALGPFLMASFQQNEDFCLIFLVEFFPVPRKIPCPGPMDVCILDLAFRLSTVRRCRVSRESVTSAKMHACDSR